MADNSVTQALHGAALLSPTTGSQQYRSCDCWPTWAIPQNVAAQYPAAGLYVPGAYACVWDVISISIPDDSAFDFSADTLQRWLLVGAAKINEYLYNRGWPVPLTAWSETVVWANCELTALGAMMKRGVNTQGDWALFNARREAVRSWCEMARDREITPDARPSVANTGTQAFRYVGPASRGWDAPRGYNGVRNVGDPWRR